MTRFEKISQKLAKCLVDNKTFEHENPDFFRQLLVENIEVEFMMRLEHLNNVDPRFVSALELLVESADESKTLYLRTVCAN